MLNTCAVKGRFAPSPSGEMHVGNIYSSLMAWLLAKSQGGSILLRIENLDPQRSKIRFADKIMRDYETLGLFWDDGPYYQDDPVPYEDAFNQLELLELLYPCFCTRADLNSASAPHQGDNRKYPGTCKFLTPKERSIMMESRRNSWRMRMDPGVVSFVDEIQGCNTVDVGSECGDVIVKRSDGVFAYQLAVVVDDARCGVNSVTRGLDLLDSTPVQMRIQNVLNFDNPTYAHVPLVVTKEGRRLSKRNKDIELDGLLAHYGTVESVIGAISYIAGLIDEATPTTPEILLGTLTYDSIVERTQNKQSIVWPDEVIHFN